MSLEYQLLTFSLSFSLVTAAKNSTDEELIRGWVSATGGRGTIDILWSSLFTIFICTWTVLHLDVPKDRDSQLWRTLEKTILMVVGIFVPELVFAGAIEEFLDAKRAKVEWERLGVKDCDLSHGFLLQMGGLEALSPSGEVIVLKYNALRLNAAGNESIDNISRNIWRRELKKITPQDIDVLAKSDYLTKGFACVQAFWLVTQVCSRAIQCLTISNLELSAVAYVLCGLATYIVWWQKPQGFTGRIPLQCETEDEYKHLDVLRGVNPPFSGKDLFFQTTVVAFIALVFGSVHCIAWDFHYLTGIERLLWRVSVMATVGAPILILLLWYCCDYDWKVDIKHCDPNFIIYVACGCLAIYCFARFYIIFEAFFSLRAGPASLYQDIAWSSYFPHI